ncbi:hypothetical protein MRB53_041207 [Persea americana]|nr:hypothetical protein MRB53_041207 [Persea americana]
MHSTSPLTTSSDIRSVPDSDEPSGLRANPSSFRAYSSSIAARAGCVSDCCAMRLTLLTGIEGLELVSCHFGIVHALKQRKDARIFLAPEVVCDCSVREFE